jgi:uncharacterized membrane protein
MTMVSYGIYKVRFLNLIQSHLLLQPNSKFLKQVLSERRGKTMLRKGSHAFIR